MNAGHNRPLLWHAAQETCEFLPRGGRPLGWFEDLPLKPVECQLMAGDVLVLYTDGLTEAENIHGEPFGEARLVEAMRACADRPANAIKEHLIATVESFRGAAPPFDDTTLVVVRYSGH